ncbi:hypothetical protein, partial [Aeromonas jandaei]|uniref:hypothetical protein n=1 Tax=Aeromonas jandaei TaxID=650 RepID=UPI002B060E20
CDCCYGKKAVLNQRKKALVLRQGLFGLAPPAGLEPATCGLTVHVPLQISPRHPIWLLTSTETKLTYYYVYLFITRFNIPSCLQEY